MSEMKRRNVGVLVNIAQQINTYKKLIAISRALRNIK